MPSRRTSRRSCGWQVVQPDKRLKLASAMARGARARSSSGVDGHQWSDQGERPTSYGRMATK
jgi:hypothetical protein